MTQNDMDLWEAELREAATPEEITARVKAQLLFWSQMNKGKQAE